MSHHTRVCSLHFLAEDVKEPTEEGGRRRLKPGAVPVLFKWNNYSLGERKLFVWDRTARPEQVETGEAICTRDHDYCVRPDTTFIDTLLEENKRLREEVAHLRQQLEQVSRSRFGTQRFAGSDVDIRFFTRYVHLPVILLILGQVYPEVEEVKESKESCHVFLPANSPSQVILINSCQLVK